jgi:hypothetical protein
MNECNAEFKEVTIEEAIDLISGARQRTIDSMIEAGIPEEEQKIILEQLDKSNE